ncbi:hypothetical protein [uncultured Desulfuromusa sp.]|uniref:hypothetical protein n=1 Tax=uncultured Desulfuromusa sp. TaxID=219183 RepID=UPI002AA746E1|nr:hypothetical protein [uncultured Desulfuromusa sp.]
MSVWTRLFWLSIERVASSRLVLLDQLAMLVSITNRRVITVAAQEQLEQNVFTNIDSAAVA